MNLMRVTPMWKSRYFWLSLLAYNMVAHVLRGVFDPVTYVGELMCWGVAAIAYMWLMPMAEAAQLEADWELPKTPRIPVK